MPLDDDVASALDNAQPESEATAPAGSGSIDPLVKAPPDTDNPSEGEKFSAKPIPPPPDVDFTKYPGFQGLESERDKLIAGQRKDTQTMLGQMADDNRTRPAVPQLQKSPEAPKAELGKGMMEFMQIAALMGALAGGRGRANTTAALNAFAGAVKGFSQGQKEAFETNLEEWKAKSKQVADDNQAKLDQYNLIWKDKNLSMEQKMGMFRIASQQWKDEITYNASKMGDYQTLAQMLQRQWEIQTQYVEKQNQILVEVEKVRQMAQLQAQRGSTEKMDVLQWQQEFATKFGRPPSEQETRDHIMEFRAQSRGATTAAGRLTQIDITAQDLQYAIPRAMVASQNLPRGRWTAINALRNHWREAQSDPALEQFRVATLDVAEKWAKSMNPTGTLQVTLAEKALDRLSTSKGPDAFQAALQQINAQVQSVQQATKDVANSLGDPNKIKSMTWDQIVEAAKAQQGQQQKGKIGNPAGDGWGELQVH